ncbi:MAG: hypothetical protein HN712_16645 [Gemmatimonadetes bacterium]|jgi:protein arginine kinase activator|nr:hypothetical protein [Gemmatimonadota bacterium]MBT7861946.1 hypothetical protein [Gemmatimonadota bacterium]
MQCESCKKREATIEFTTVAGDEKKTAHLCAACATQISQQQAETDDTTATGSDQKIEPTPAKKKKVNVVVGHLSKSDSKTAACPDCGMTYDEFRKLGRLGCSSCYTAFAKPLRRLLKRIHGADHHVGRVPGAAPTVVEEIVEGNVTDVQRLRSELVQAVENEAYERAAELRDQIARLEAADA